ncbi:hypothetical protein ACVIU4_005155 [Bradyrhizobium barranii subsp. barranii]|nr:hypothetical protein [Bradyrhizobium japonicum]MCP1957350.1 hypothetical protein [Bradyrhizobium japonicum]
MNDDAGELVLRDLFLQIKRGGSFDGTHRRAHRSPGYQGSSSKVESVVCDVVCTGRFYDFLERAERWGFVLRQPIYEKDRIDPVDPTATLKLDWTRLMSFPEGYRHLAYLQLGMGYSVKADMPGLTGPEVDALYIKGAHWLKGESIEVIDAETPRLAA